MTTESCAYLCVIHCYIIWSIDPSGFDIGFAGIVTELGDIF